MADRSGGDRERQLQVHAAEIRLLYDNAKPCAGALGVGSSLIYAPAFYAQTDELTALCKVAAEYDGGLARSDPRRGTRHRRAPGRTASTYRSGRAPVWQAPDGAPGRA